MSTGSGRLVQRRRRLDPRPESARLARSLVLEALSDAGRPDLVDVAGLLVSELVTNAIVHARTDIDLDVVAGPDGVRVSVHDASPSQPTLRHYGAAATTGRGLELVELLSDRHGIAAGDGGHSTSTVGKTMWFELGTGLPGSAEESPAGNVADEPPATLDDAPALTVLLKGLPVRLALAWQQHADALLRELLLSRWDEDGPLSGNFPGNDAAANDAFSAVAAALEAIGPPDDLPAYVDMTLPLPHTAPAHFTELDAVMEHVCRLAEMGQTLAPPTLPEIRLLRGWISGQVRDQAAGGKPKEWTGVPLDSPAAVRAPLPWDPTAVREATEAVVAGDDRNRILAASRSAKELLGWDDDLIGQRLLAVIPERYRDAHVASFTLQILTGETTILDQEITVPALRRDGVEVPVRLLVQRENLADGRAVFTARMTPL